MIDVKRACSERNCCSRVHMQRGRWLDWPRFLNRCTLWNRFAGYYKEPWLLWSTIIIITSSWLGSWCDHSVQKISITQRKLLLPFPPHIHLIFLTNLDNFSADLFWVDSMDSGLWRCRPACMQNAHLKYDQLIRFWECSILAMNA